MKNKETLKTCTYFYIERGIRMIEWISIFLKEWLIPIVAALIGALLLFMMDFLPDNWKVHRRLLFMLKVKKTVCQIKISIPLKEDMDFNIVERAFDKFWGENILNPKISEGGISFFSKRSSSQYDIYLSEDDEEEKSFLIIENINGLGLGIFGGIKNLEETTNELQDLSDLFAKYRDSNQTIMSEFTITPRIEKFFHSNMKGEVHDKKYTCSFTAKNIIITNKGFFQLRNNISKSIYEWMGHFI